MSYRSKYNSDIKYEYLIVSKSGVGSPDTNRYSGMR